jgi:hypothetical protein
MRGSNFFHRLFYFFWGSLVQIEEGQHKLGPLAFQRRGPQLRNDPVAHLNAEYQTELARVSSQDVGAPLTRVSATFSAATRELSQNGNWIRVMSIIESLQRPSRSVPSDGVSIASIARGVQSANACGRDTAWLQDSAPLARAGRVAGCHAFHPAPGCTHSATSVELFVPRSRVRRRC